MVIAKEKMRDNYYLSERLLHELRKIPQYPLTVVEAPSGAGKTTAVREYLKEHIAQAINEYWYTVIGETASKAWENICGLFYQFDNETAAALSRLGMPTGETLSDIARIMRNCRCDLPTVLVVDNYQLINSPVQREIISALSYSGSSNLHIVVITQELGLPPAGGAYNNRILTLGKEALFFTKSEAASYFRQGGLRISEQELDKVMGYTEGWVAALCLQTLHYRTTGSFGNSGSIVQLVRTAIWNRLEKHEQHFLLALSLFGSFTAEQGQIMLDKDELPAYAQTLLEKSSFIRCDQNKGEYIIHALLGDFLQGEFANLPAVMKKQLWKRAGKAYALRREYFKAAHFYYLTGDFEALLSLPIKGSDLAGHISVNFSCFLTGILNDCPKEILYRYPNCLLIFTFQLFLVGDYGNFHMACGIIAEMLQSPETYSLGPAEVKRISGEFALMMSFSKFNDIKKMSKGHKMAWTLLGGPTTLYNWEDFWTFGQPSVMYLLWSKSGELESQLSCLDECMPIYTRLTMGHGTAGEHAMRAEALLMAGEDLAAEPLCHKALFLASGKKQNSICYAAELILARIALLRGNIEDYKSALVSIENRVCAPAKYDGRATADLCKGFLAAVLGHADELAPWIFDPDNMWKKLFKFAIPYGQMLYVKGLLLEGKNAAVIGVADALMPVVQELHFMLPQIYLSIYTAIAKQRLGNGEDALKDLCRGLAIALPDKVYLPFAEHEEILPLLQRAKEKEAAGGEMDALLCLYRRQSAGIAAIKKALSLEPMLTVREYEAALLVQKGLANKEIAEMLFVTEDTVKSHLKSIYRKLGIRSRLQLNDYDLKK